MEQAHAVAAILEKLMWALVLLAGFVLGVKTASSRDLSSTHRQDASLRLRDFSPRPILQKPYPSPEDVEALVFFLQRVFTAEEMRALVRRVAGEEALVQLREDSPAHCAECTVGVLSRMREIDEEFFLYLYERRPKWAKEIDQLKARWIERD